MSVPALFLSLIGLSRIYLGDHWATDVLGGYLLGSGWLGLCLAFYRILRQEKQG